MIRLYVTPFFLFLLLLWIGSYSSVFPREIPLPEEEAPKALFSAELYDADVDFFIEGSWTASLQGGTGLTWGDGVEGVQPAVLSDFTDGFKFEQVPQLSLSLWYMDRYFFETTITKEQQLETFLFGYFGREGEFLQEARVGNTDIGFGDYGVFAIPAASRHSLGAYGRFEGGYSEHHLAARYDPAQLEELHFRGSRLIEEQRVAPADFRRGRFFVLPDADIDFLRVYVQDDRNGTMSDDEGRRYRRLDEDEMVYSLEEGLLFLRQPATSDVVVYYEKGVDSVGDVGLGTGALAEENTTGLSLAVDAIDFEWGITYLDIATNTWQRDGLLGTSGNSALLLYSPGQWSPFELLSVYNAGAAVKAAAGNTTLWLAAKNSSGGSRLPIEQFQDADKARIAPTGFDLRSHEARYPLLLYTDESSWAQSLYGPGGGTEPIDRELRFEQLSQAGGYNLGSNALEGSITVLRNGVPEQRFTFNPDTGELNFFIPPSRNERIDIRYRTTSAQAIGGDIFAAAINRFSFNEQWSADLNLGLRWNADPNAYITEPGEAEGSMLTAGRLAYRSDRFGFALESGINVRSPNTTGRLRLYGMNDSAFPVSINGELMYPGAPVTDGAYDSISAEAVGEHFHNNRGKLLFSDFYNYSFAGGYQLQHYSWDPPSDQTYPYAKSGGNNRTGPYIAATGSETEGNAMVMEYSLTGGEWVGGTIPLAEGNGAVDLSHVQAITLLVKHIGRGSSEPSESINLHLLLGRLYEDLDTDGKLDEEDSPLDGGFDFNDEGYVLPVAPSLRWSPERSRVNSEDLDGNDVLDGYTATLSTPVIKTLDGYSSQWKQITITLSDTDREKLKAATGIEFLIENTSATEEAEGRLLIADIDLEGAPFTGASTNDTDFSVFTRALDPGGSSYKSLMSQPEAELLNEDSVFNTKVTRVEWGTNSWAMTGYHTPVQLEEYESFSFFMRTKFESESEPDTPPDKLTLILRNPQNEGLAVEFTPKAHTDWRRYTWKLHSSDPDDRLLVDGEPLPGAQLVTPGDGIIRNNSAVGVNEFSIEGDVSSAGAIEIDEVYLHDPRLDMGVGGRTSVEYRYPEALISLGETPVLHQLQFRQTVYGRQEGDRKSTRLNSSHS